MSPIVKKALIAIGVKKAVEKINEARRPEPKKSRFGKFLVVAAGAGLLAYAYNSGKLQPLVDKIRGQDSTRGSSSNGAGAGRDVTFSSEDRPLSSPVT